MAKTSAGNRAYHESRQDGFSKEESRQASRDVDEKALSKFEKDLHEKYGKETTEINYDTDMHWHDSSDL